MPSVSTTPLIECRHCGLIIQKKSLQKNEKALCPRCESVVYSAKARGNLKYCFAFALASLLLFFPANLFPVLTFGIGEERYSATFFDGMAILYENEFYLVSLLVFLTALIFPLFNNALVVYLYLQKRFSLKWGKSERLFKYYKLFRKWSFIDIYLLGIILSYIKLIDTSETEVNLGSVMFCMYLVCYILAQLNFNPRLLLDER